MIRKGVLEDAEKITAILAETLTPWSLDGVISSINKDFCLVFEDKEIDGVIFVSRVADECEILNFAVSTDKRDNGLGNALLKEALSSEFVRNGDVFLDVRESNLSAIHLYKKFGFTEIFIRKNYYSNPLENAIIMKLER